VSVPDAAATKERGPASAALDAPPRVLVMPSGDAYLVLRSRPVQLGDGAAWDVLYLAGGDPADLARPEAQARLASTAGDLLEAFHPLAEVLRLGRLSVTAMVGEPGGRGVTDQRWFARDAGRWRADGAARSQAVAQVPAIDPPVVRDQGEEASARDAATAFISDTERSDYDAAWARTSALVKAVMSRTEFERRLAALSRADGAGGARLYLSFPAPTERFLPGAFMEAWLVRENADGFGVQTLALRLDDDGEWRIAGVVEVTAAPEPTANPTPPVFIDVLVR
jgi:hypothetical protein